MNKKNPFSKIHTTLHLSLSTLVCSCAPMALKNVKPIYPQKSVEIKPIVQPNPTQVIDDFKISEQKKQLDAVVAEEAIESPDFLKNVQNDKVDFWINYFTKRDKKRFERYLANGAKYQSIIEEILLDHGLPKELYYVGLIESGYNLKARSHANAVGPWQFIKSTAKRYGLNVKNGVDERKSIHKSTRAAALFFQDLYNIFGSWELALSAYNAGEYGIIRRIRKANTRDYYELSQAKSIPKETRNYIPKVLAVIKILKQPQHYNINMPTPSHPYENTKFIELEKSFHLSQFANKSSVTISTLRKLNPDLTTNRTPKVANKYLLRVPNGNYAFIKDLNQSSLNTLNTREVASYNKLSAPNANAKIYQVKSGDNLSIIAKKFQVTISDLKRINNIRKKDHLLIGQKIKIPKIDLNYSCYTVKRGDNLYSIARKNHTTVSEILKLNNGHSKKLKNKTIYPGDIIFLPLVSKTFYTVKPGDYLGRIASKFGLSIQEIKSLNSMRRSRIYPGQRLVVKLD
jgi:membrane-bound lytic murein transglycosylase D